MKKVLITGINGFLGSSIANALKNDFIVIGLELNQNNLHRIKKENYKLYFIEENGLRNIFEENEFYSIIHTATIYRRNNDPIDKLLQTNVFLPIKLYELANDFGVEIFLNTDTFFNNRSSNKYNYLKDYTLSKRHLIEWLEILKNKTKIVNMKVFHMYGPNDNIDKFVPQMLNKLINNEPFVELTPGEQLRDFIYVDDVANAFKTILLTNPSSEQAIDEYEVGTGISSSIKEFLIKMKEYLNSQTELRFASLPYRDNEIMVSKADISKLTKLGWRPVNNLDNGIKKLIESYRK
jgi:nucleoside-diphosphate-sugar epimerase